MSLWSGPSFFRQAPSLVASPLRRGERQARGKKGSVRDFSPWMPLRDQKKNGTGPLCIHRWQSGTKKQRWFHVRFPCEPKVPLLKLHDVRGEMLSGPWCRFQDEFQGT